jgi:hypothetical protein
MLHKLLIKNLIIRLEIIKNKEKTRLWNTKTLNLVIWRKNKIIRVFNKSD